MRCDDSSGCSTLLKTLAGEMNGIYKSHESMLNYQGKHLVFFSLVHVSHRLTLS